MCNDKRMAERKPDEDDRHYNSDNDTQQKCILEHITERQK